MMKRIKLLTILILIFMLTGCSLAVPDAQINGQDMFRGFWVVEGPEPVDVQTFDVNDKTQQVLLLYQSEQDGNTSIGSVSGSSFGKVSLSVNETDDKTDNRIEATLSMIPTRDDTMIIMHNIYQRPDGTLYAEDFGHGMSGSIDGSATEITQSSTQTINGNIKGYSMTCKIAVKVVDYLQKITLHQYNKAGEELSAADYTAFDSKEIYVLPDAAYVIVEEHYMDADGDNYTLHTLYDRPHTSYSEAIMYTAFFPGDNGFTKGARLYINF